MNPLNIICYLKFIEERKNDVFVQKLNSNILENLKLEFHRQRVLFILLSPSVFFSAMSELIGEKSPDSFTVETYLG
jgi:hypothetical protein